jgi:hypothetical protein
VKREAGLPALVAIAQLSAVCWRGVHVPSSGTRPRRWDSLSLYSGGRVDLRVAGRFELAGTALHVNGGSSAGRQAPRQEIAFHRGLGRFYRRFDAPAANPLPNAAVYAGIGAKLAVSLALTALRGR